ncbi:hypothetical protein L0F63_006044, partial [Massospora cicadina]
YSTHRSASTQPSFGSQLKLATHLTLFAFASYLVAIDLFKSRPVQETPEAEPAMPKHPDVDPSALPVSDPTDTRPSVHLQQQEDLSRVYDAIASKYDGLTSADELVMGMHLLRRWLIKKYAKGDVLELSSGTGRNMKYYHPTIGSRHPITSLTFVERSANMIDVALKAPATTHLVDAFKRGRRRIRFYPVDAHSLAIFNDDSFDTVVDTFGLCSYQDPVRVLLEMQRVCKPDGRIVLLQHGRADYAFLNQLLDTSAAKRALKWGCWWNRDILELLKRSKLRVTYLNRWHFGTTYYVVAAPNKEL